ncbi:MAG: hypothetical protein FH758_14340 [Firmicutes bacterium]|nr:hypothetical protein [Bacillota bacterium]
MNMEQNIFESLHGLKDPETGNDLQINKMDVDEEGNIILFINSSSEDTNYTSVEKEIAQRVLAFEGVKQVQVRFQ